MRQGDGMTRDSFSLAVAIGLTTGTRFFYHMLVSRRLGTADYGDLVTLLGLLVLLTLPVNALQLAVAHHTAALVARGDRAGARRLFLRAHPAFLLAGAAVGGLVWTAAGPLGRFLRIDDRFLLGLLATMGVWNLLLGLVRGSLQGLQQFRAVGAVLLLDGVLKIAAAALWMAAGDALRGAMGANVASAAAAWTIGIGLVAHALPRDKVLRGAPPPRVVPMLRYAMPVLLALLGYSILGYLDVFMVKHLFAEHEAGLYAAAAIVGKTFLFIPDAVALTLFSKTSENYALHLASRALLVKALALTGALLAPSLLACALVPGPIVRLLFGEAFLPAAGLVRRFGFAMIPFVFLSVVVHYSLAQHRYRILWPLYAGSALYAALLLRSPATSGAVLRLLFTASAVILLASLAAARGRPGRSAERAAK